VESLELVVAWLTETLNTPVLDLSLIKQAQQHVESPRLMDIPASARLAELEFYLPLKQFHQEAFNQLLKTHQFPAKPPYQFGSLNGMLKGFIDLTFEYDGRFYVADYKSNHLGDDYHHYAFSSMDESMRDHDYYLQGLFYTVALHRYLKVRLPQYDFDKHIGGAVYLFMRGMHPDAAGKGVLHFLPKKALVLGLDALFNGEFPQEGETEQVQGGQDAI